MAERSFRIRRALKVDGQLSTPDATEITVVLEDSRGILLAYGATVPPDAEVGFAKGCIFIDTNASAGAVMLANEGDADSCDFNTSLVSGDISAVTAGLGLSGGGASGGVTLNFDGSHIVVFAGQFTTVGGDANEQATVAGVLATDIVIACLEDNGTNNVTLLTSAAATDAINFVLSGDPAADTIINYQVLRVTA